MGDSVEYVGNTLGRAADSIVCIGDSTGSVDNSIRIAADIPGSVGELPMLSPTLFMALSPILPGVSRIQPTPLASLPMLSLTLTTVSPILLRVSATIWSMSATLSMLPAVSPTLGESSELSPTIGNSFRSVGYGSGTIVTLVLKSSTLLNY